MDMITIKKELLAGIYNLIPNLPRDTLNKRSPSLFCLIGSVSCRDTSSSMITLSISMSYYWDNLPRGPSDTASREQHLSVPVFPPSRVTRF